MYSEMALEDIQLLIDEGLKPTPKDIIKLNALALKFQAAKERNSGSSIYNLHRVAYLSEKIYFLEPTIGHEIWMKLACRFVNMSDFNTIVSIQAYAFSRHYDNLCDPNSEEDVLNNISSFCELMKEYSFSLIYQAIDYVKFGCSLIACEFAETLKQDNIIEEDDDYDWDECIAVGILNKAAALPIGCTLAELKRMTRLEVLNLITRSLMIHNHKVDTKALQELKDYYLTYDAIKERLLKDKING